MWSDLDPDQTIRCPRGVKPWQKRAVNGGRCRDCRRLIFDLLNFSAIPSILFSCSALSPRPTTHATRSPTRPNTDKNAARAPKNGQHCHILAISIPRPPKLAARTNPSPQGGPETAVDRIPAQRPVFCDGAHACYGEHPQLLGCLQVCLCLRQFRSGTLHSDI